MLRKYVIVLMPLCLALAQNAAPPQEPVWGPQSGPWRLAISSERDHYVLGEAIEVSALLTNGSENHVAFVNSGPMLFIKGIRLPMPASIPWKPRAPLLPRLEAAGLELVHITSWDVPPEWRRVWPYSLNQLYDMSALGEYRIVFSTEQFTVTRMEGAEAPRKSKVTILSNEITITVPPKAQ